MHIASLLRLSSMQPSTTRIRTLCVGDITPDSRPDFTFLSL